MKERKLQPVDMLAAFEHTSDGVYAVDSDERIVFWNRQAEELFGVPASDVLGRRCYEVIGGADYAGHPLCGPNCLVMKCARKGITTGNFDLRVKDASGRERLINVSSVVLKARPARLSVAVHLFREAAGRAGALDSGAASEAEPVSAGTRLTPRETEVLRLLSEGLDNRTIADRLSVSPTTVRNHIEHLLAKLGVHSRLAAVVYAARHRLL